MNSMFVNREAEESVLSLILKSDDNRHLVPEIQEEDLSVREYRIILRAMKQLFMEKKPIDAVTVSSTVKSLMPSENPAAVNAALLGLQRGGFLAEYHLREHLRILKETSLRRKMLDILNGSRRRLIETEEETAAVLENIRQELRELVTTGHSWESMTDILLATYSALEKRSKGTEETMPSGIVSLDRKTMGFHKGELTIIGARPAVGKSAFGAQIALAAAAKGFKVGICSREMTDIQYGLRIIAKESGVLSEHLRSGKLQEEEWCSVAETMGYISQYPMAFIFTTRYIEDLRMEVQKKVDAGELDLLMVDYTQLMQARQKFDKDYLRIGYVSKMLKDMTTDFNIAVIALAQVARSRENEMPTLSDLRGSGDLEQDADNVIFLHRPKDTRDKYVHPDDKASFDQLTKSGLQYIAVDVAKQRQGETGTTAVIFDPARMRYTAIDRGER